MIPSAGCRGLGDRGRIARTAAPGQTCASATPKAGGSARMPVGDRQREEAAAARERVDGHLLPRHDAPRRGRLARERETRRASSTPLERPPGASTSERPSLTLAIRCLDDAREAELAGARRRAPPASRQSAWRAAEPPPRRTARAGAASRPRARQCRARAGARSPRRCGEPRRDRHRPVDPGRDDPVEQLGAREPVEAFLVLGGHDRAPVRVLEARGGGIAVAGDHEQAALPCGPKEPELRRPGA